MNMPNKKQIFFVGELSIFMGVLYLFVTNPMDLVKAQIPRVGLESILSICFLFGDNRGLRFSVR